MSYYDFDNHFWSPKTVCCQSPSPKSGKKRARSNMLVSFLSLTCVVVWTPLVLQLLVPVLKENHEKIAHTVSYGSDSDAFERSRFLLFRSAQQQ
ncbi:MAG: hypothetical protein SAK29_12205 [Scytonema sp. PMC 1069.18]|nr:hypothetical protein [Scytonema sp. PMC 1069.18]MEC4886672.1 hypothetical protein [Scytonema sp. PMC 1070.18]